MRRVLLITYFYPPQPSIGSVRPAGLVKYLPEAGWEPIVLTPRLPGRSPSSARIIETEYRDVLGVWKARLGFEAGQGLHDQLRLPVTMATRRPHLHTRAIGLVKRLLTYPDPMRGWIPFAVEAVRNFARVERVDAIVSTAPPVSSHVIGHRAKAALGCPWIADFRDIWMQYDSDGPLGRLAKGRWDRRLLKPADALVTVSEGLASRFQASLPGLPVHCVTNGFDPDEFPPGDGELTKTFSITYTGFMHNGVRDPRILLTVMADLVRDGRIDPAKVRLRFYGSAEPWFVESVRSLGVERMVEVHSMVPRAVAIARQRESQMLLLLVGTGDDGYTKTYPAKVFEYLASRRPILAAGGSSAVAADLLKETRAGIYVDSADQLRDVVLKAYGEFEQTGRVSYAGDERLIGRYTQREMAKKFAAILDSVTGHAGGAGRHRAQRLPAETHHTH